MDDRDLFGKVLAMLHIGALSQMGFVENPVTGKRRVDLKTASETIEMIAMLSRRMNLEDDERQHLDSILTDLRLRYAAFADLISTDDEEDDFN